MDTCFTLVRTGIGAEPQNSQSPGTWGHSVMSWDRYPLCVPTKNITEETSVGCQWQPGDNRISHYKVTGPRPP